MAALLKRGMCAVKHVSANEHGRFMWHLYHIRTPINIAIPIGPNVNNYQGFQFFGVFNHAGILIIIGVLKNKLTIYERIACLCTLEKRTAYMCCLLYY